MTPCSNERKSKGITQKQAPTFSCQLVPLAADIQTFCCVKKKKRYLDLDLNGFFCCFLTLKYNNQ